MPNKSFDLKYGKSTVTVSVPAESLLGVLLPREPHLPDDERAELERALDEPIGSGRIEEIAGQGLKTVIMVSDMTRPSPSYKLLPPLLSRLGRAGMPDSDITIVFGMGIHRHMTDDEKRALVGADVFARYRCVESTGSGEYVALGVTSRGTPVEVCPDVAACDLLICTGNIEYHYFAGYSGGVKAVLPGACNQRTVEANHAMQLLPGAELGSYDNNPVRQDMEEAGKIIGVDFILNVVLDEKKNIVKAVAGDPVKALAVGRKVVDDLYGIPIQRQADIVLVSAGGRPKDVNIYQAQKALENATRAVRDGGIIVLVAECPEGLGERNFEEYMTGYPLDEIIERVRARFVLGAHKAAAIARTLKKAGIHLASAVDPALVAACKMKAFGSAQEAIDAAFGELGGDASVLVMPFGGSTAPFVRR
jgi:nickel-dependent lactate racemase